MQTHYETIIVGGGISGLSCARKLHDAGRNFLLITEELGGRMKIDEKTRVNMGAGFILSNYKNVKKYVRKKTPVSGDKIFLCDTECISLYSIVLQNLKRLPTLLILLFLVLKFKLHLEHMRRKLPFLSFKKALGEDLFLLDMFSTPARNFVQKHKLEDLTEQYINPVIAATFYTNFYEMNAYCYLVNISFLFSRMYVPDLPDTIKQLTDGFEEKIHLDTVIKVVRSAGTFSVQTTRETVTSKNIVFAAPEEHLRKIYSLPRPYIQQSVHRFVICGQRRREYQDKRSIFFNPRKHSVLKMTKIKHGYDIISAKRKPDFEKYYTSYEIINHTHWQPATIISQAAIEQNLEKGVYLASDYNLSTLEDSFLTGLYAANQIIKRSKK